MKYILSFFAIVAICCGICFCKDRNEEIDDDFMRIHIIANSNSIDDQNIKYLVKDVVVEYLIPYLSEAQDKEEAKLIINQQLSELELLVNATLKNNKANYCCNIVITQEDMPMRAYGDLVLSSGVYDSLKINLGNAQGDNWWCVVFPAVCFISSKNSENFVYISKIWEIINNVTQKTEDKR